MLWQKGTEHGIQMEPSVAILLYSIVLVLVVPVVFAALYLELPALRVLKIATIRKIEQVSFQLHQIPIAIMAPKNISLEEARQRLSIKSSVEDKIHLLRLFTFSMRRTLEQHKFREQQLKDELAEIEKKHKLLAQSKSDQDSMTSRALLDAMRHAKQVIADQQCRTGDVLAQLMSLEFEKNSLAVQLPKNNSTVKRFLLHDTRILRARTVIERMELKIIEREQAAQKLLSQNLQSTAPSLLQRMELKVLQRENAALKILEQKTDPTNRSAVEKSAEDFVNRIFNASESFVRSIVNVGSTAQDFVATADPSVKRAFARLERDLQSARLLALKAEEEEEHCKERIENTVETSLGWSREESSDWKAHKQPNDQIDASKRRTTKKWSKSCQEILKKLRIRNLSIQQRLYRAEGIVKRLNVIRWLLSTLPDRNNNVFAQYTSLTNALSKYLRSMGNKQSLTDGDDPPPDFRERLSQLEDRVLLAFLRIAKGDSALLNEDAYSRLEGDIATISMVIELDRADALVEYKKWNAIADQAFADKQELLHAVAEVRTTQNIQILRFAEKTLDVLNVTASLSEEKRRKNKVS